MARLLGRLSVVVLFLVLAGCSAGGGPVASSSGGAAGSAPASGSGAGASGRPAASGGGGRNAVPAACTLLTKAQIATFLGEAAADPQGGLNVTGDDESDCDWQQADTSSGLVHLVQLQVFVSTKYLSRTAYKPDEMLGDFSIPGAAEAFGLKEGGGRGVGINMIVGSRRVVIHFTPGGKATDAPARYLDPLKALATILVAAVAAH